MKAGTPTPDSMDAFPYNVYTQLPIVNPTSVTKIQADVAIVETAVEKRRKDLCGDRGPVLQQGDIRHRVLRRRLGGGVPSQVGGQRLKPGGMSGITQPPKIRGRPQIAASKLASVAIGTTYTLSIEYEASTPRFIFKIGSTEETFGVGDTDWPTPRRAALKPYKVLQTLARATNNASDSAYMWATFDNVILNNSVNVYDDFSSLTIDNTKWTTYDFAREIFGG